MDRAGALNVEAVEGRIGYTFRDRKLLSIALVHRSALSAGENNEKFEFLGDAVLDLAVSDFLMERNPRAKEGELSKRRAALVNSRVLASKASELGLGDALRLGKGEEKSGGRRKSSILSAAYEAVLGAVYLDGGFGAARDLVAKHFATELAGSAPDSSLDAKTRLQEMTQRLFKTVPIYRLVQSSGPDHDKAFVVEITLEGRVCGQGHGKSKKAAEQAAAIEALATLESGRSI